MVNALSEKTGTQDLEKKVVMIRESKEAATAARKDRANKRIDKVREIVGDFNNNSKLRNDAVDSASIEFKNKKHDLTRVAQDLQELGAPLSAEEMDTRMHEIKRSVGGDARELAKKSKRIKASLKLIEGEIDAEDKGINEVSDKKEVDRAKEGRGYMREQVRKIFDNKNERSNYSEYVSNYEKKLDNALDNLSSLKAEMNERLRNFNLTIDGELEKAESEPMVKKFIEDFNQENGSLMKEIEVLKKNIELCDHPQLEGFLFKKPILFDGENKFKTSIEKLEVYKSRYERQLREKKSMFGGRLSVLINKISLRTFGAVDATNFEPLTGDYLPMQHDSFAEKNPNSSIQTYEINTRIRDKRRELDAEYAQLRSQSNEERNAAMNKLSDGVKKIVGDLYGDTLI